MFEVGQIPEHLEADAVGTIERGAAIVASDALRVLLTTRSEDGGEDLGGSIVHRLRPGIGEVHLEALLEAASQIGNEAVVIGLRVGLVRRDLGGESCGLPSWHDVRKSRNRGEVCCSTCSRDQGCRTNRS